MKKRREYKNTQIRKEELLQEQKKKKKAREEDGVLRLGCSESTYERRIEASA